MSKQTKQFVLAAVAILALGASAYFVFFYDRTPKADPAAQQAEQALTQSYKAAEEEMKTKAPKQAADLFAEPPAPTSPGGGIRSVGKPTPK